MTIPGTPGKHNSPGTPGETISIKSARSISNVDWVSKSGPEAKIAKMKDGTTHLAYKPGNAVDLDTGAVVAAELHPADRATARRFPRPWRRPRQISRWSMRHRGGGPGRMRRTRLRQPGN